MWRLNKYDLDGRSHTVIRLDVHLPSYQRIVFKDPAVPDPENVRQAIQKKLDESEERGTVLTKWFQLNRDDVNARNLFYREIPKHYRFDRNTWIPRQRDGSRVLSRLYSVSPKDVERFSLRLLLLHVKSATSFEFLRTVNGQVHPTFREAALALNLLKDNEDWEKVLDEAVVFRMPRELRILLASIITHGEATSHAGLFEKYKKDLIEDFLRRHDPIRSEQLALLDIQSNIEQFGMSLTSVGLPSVNFPQEELLSATADETDEELLFQYLERMNDEQQAAFQTIMDSVNGTSPKKCFFLSGAGGCGKTFVYKALIAAVTTSGGSVKTVAPTGLAATLLKGGRTIHSGFGIPIEINETTTSRFTRNSPEGQEIRRTKLIIWDEISMSTVGIFNAVDRSLRFLTGCNSPFGGIPVVVGGDFRQQAPVVIHGSRVQVIEACVKSSNLWRHFEEVTLIRNMRVRPNEQEFSEWLLSVGNGLSDSGSASDYVRIPEECLSDDVVSSIFGDVASFRNEEIASRAILCPKNEDTLAINEKILGLLAGSPSTFYSTDAVLSDDEEEKRLYPTEFLNSLTPMGLPPHALNLKVGCCVMLLRNLNPKRGLCNGTRLIVESMGANLIGCRVLSGDSVGEKVFLPRIPMDSSKQEVPFVLRRRQFPLRLAYAMTITKSQGQTFDRIGLLLPEPVFTHGQLYTAMSRARSKDGLSVEVRNSRGQGRVYENDEQTYTFNCIYKEIL